MRTYFLSYMVLALLCVPKAYATEPNWQTYAIDQQRLQMAAEVDAIIQRVDYCYALDCALEVAKPYLRQVAERCVALAGREDGAKAHAALKVRPMCGHLVAFLLENADDFSGREREFHAATIPPTAPYRPPVEATPSPERSAPAIVRSDGDFDDFTARGDLVADGDGAEARTPAVPAPEAGPPCDPDYAFKKEYVFVGATDEELAAAGLRACE